MCQPTCLDQETDSCVHNWFPRPKRKHDWPPSYEAMVLTGLGELKLNRPVFFLKSCENSFRTNQFSYLSVRNSSTDPLPHSLPLEFL